MPQHQPITPLEFANKMREINTNKYEYQNEEDTHIAMDNVMCDLLRSFGYDDGIDIFISSPKWYS